MISDSIKYYYFLKSEIFERELKKSPLVYVSMGNVDFVSLNGRCPNFRRLLEILEIDPDRIQLITQPTQFNKIILPAESFYLDTDGRKFTEEYRETIDRVKQFALKNRTPISNKRFYYFYGRKDKVIGEERLAEYLKSKGYDIISPEKLTLDEQLNLMINCESFATTIGSCSHNSLFLRNGSKVILIPRTARGYNSYQSAMNQVNSIDVTYIDSSLSIFSGNYKGYYLLISEQLKRFFSDKWNGYEEEDLKTFLQYVKNSMSNGYTFNLKQKDYYSPVLQNFMEQLKNRKDLVETCDMPLGWETLISV